MLVRRDGTQRKRQRPPADPEWDLRLRELELLGTPPSGMGKEVLDDQVSVRIQERAVRRDRLPGQDRILGRAERTRRRVLEGMWAHQDGLLGYAHRDVGRVLEADPHRPG